MSKQACRLAGQPSQRSGPLTRAPKHPNAVTLQDQLLHPQRFWLRDHTDLPQSHHDSTPASSDDSYSNHQGNTSNCGEHCPSQKPAMAKRFISDPWHYYKPTCSQLTPDEDTAVGSIPTHLAPAMASASSQTRHLPAEAVPPAETPPCQAHQLTTRTSGTSQPRA